MKIKANILRKIKSDKYLKAKLTVPCACSIHTIERWCNPSYRPRRKDMPSPLLNEAALQYIRDHFNLTNEQILDRSKQVA